MNTSFVEAASLLTSTNFLSCPVDTSNITQSKWDILNPILFFQNEEIMSQYANTTACSSLDPNSNILFSFLNPFCVDLLPFCIFYAFIKIIVSIINYIFIYQKRIEKRLNVSREDSWNDRVSQSKQDYINYFQSFLRTSFILDIISAMISLWIFKGYQHYASYFSVDPNSNLILLGNYQASQDLGQILILYLCSLFWFVLECWKAYIQIFSVSSLTHLDNLKKESEKKQEEKFYRKHHKYSLWWTLMLFLTGTILLTLNFFWKVWIGNDQFQDFKLYYRYFSTSTIAFWLSYGLISILIFTDRVLSYNGFKQRQNLKEEERRRATVSLNSSEPQNPLCPPTLSDLQVSSNSQTFKNLQQIVRRKFPEKPLSTIEEISKKIAGIYNEKMENHYKSLRRKIDTNYSADMDDEIIIETSMGYISFLRWFNILNLIGYTMILFSYQQGEQELWLYLIGFLISSSSTFAFELTHNYLLYRSYFLEILVKMKKRDEKQSTK